MSLIRPQGSNRVRKTAQEDIDINRLEEIKEEMLELLDEADRLLSGAEGMVYDRAKAYWIPHIKMALTKEHDYLGGSMETLEDTIEELREPDAEEEGE